MTNRNNDMHYTYIEWSVLFKVKNSLKSITLGNGKSNGISSLKENLQSRRLSFKEGASKSTKSQPFR